MHLPDAGGSDTVSTAGKQKPHAVIRIQFPVFGGDVQQPAFGDESVEKREQHFVMKGLFPQRQVDTEPDGILIQVIGIILKGVTGFVLRQASGQPVI